MPKWWKIAKSGHTGWMEGSNRCSKKSFFVKIWKLVFSCSLLHIFWFMVHHHQILAQLSLLHPFVMKEVSTQNFFLKMGQSQPLFVYFVLFKHKFYRKNCRRQQDSNSDLWSRRRARWPLDHHHGPLKTFSLKCESDELRWNFWVLIQQILCSIGSLFTWKASSRPLFRLLQLQAQFQSYNFFL